jgi:phage terminase small subunit
MSKHDIRERIDKRLNEKENALIATQDEILKTLTRILRREEKDHTVVTLKSRSTSFDDYGRKVIEEKEESEVIKGKLIF